MRKSFPPDAFAELTRLSHTTLKAILHGFLTFWADSGQSWMIPLKKTVERTLFFFCYDSEVKNYFYRFFALFRCRAFWREKNHAYKSALRLARVMAGWTYLSRGSITLIVFNDVIITQSRKCAYVLLQIQNPTVHFFIYNLSQLVTFTVWYVRLLFLRDYHARKSSCPVRKR